MVGDMKVFVQIRNTFTASTAHSAKAINNRQAVMYINVEKRCRYSNLRGAIRLTGAPNFLFLNHQHVQTHLYCLLITPYLMTKQ